MRNPGAFTPNQNKSAAPTPTKITHLPCHARSTKTSRIRLAAISKSKVPGPTMKIPMQARVYVSMKPSVLDPQGQTICSALNGMGHKEIAAVRQGKYFEITLPPAIDKAAAARLLDEVARDVLSNPVIEDYQVEILD
jgi:phosphoribosylformylglycinamidine synthase